LWFLAVLIGLGVLTPAALAAVRRWGAWSALAPWAVVSVVDGLRFALWPAAPAWLGWLNVPAAWLVPYLLGIAAAQGRLRGRGTGAALLAAGALGALALVRWGGYPASMVGVPGQGRSNLDPPSLVVVYLAVAQVGAVCWLWQPLSRLLRHPAPAALATAVNRRIFTIFLWHQSALLLVVGAVVALSGPPAGLLLRPTGLAWVGYRLAWLPVFALALAALVGVFHRVETVRRPVPVPPPRVPVSDPG
jgi:hypothetical protein